MSNTPPFHPTPEQMPNAVASLEELYQLRRVPQGFIVYASEIGNYQFLGYMSGESPEEPTTARQWYRHTDQPHQQAATWQQLLDQLQELTPEQLAYPCAWYSVRREAIGSVLGIILLPAGATLHLGSAVGSKLKHNLPVLKIY